jgi:hypothetical protein
MEDVDSFYSHLAYIFCFHLVYLWSFGRFFPVLVSCTKKNLATLVDKMTFCFFGGAIKSKIFVHALAAWSSGIVSACGVVGLEIESRLGGRFLKNVHNAPMLMTFSTHMKDRIFF